MSRASAALDRILLARAAEQAETATRRVGSGSREEHRQDVLNAPPAPRRWKRQKCLGCGEPTRGRKPYCKHCGVRVAHGTSLEAVDRRGPRRGAR